MYYRTYFFNTSISFFGREKQLPVMGEIVPPSQAKIHR